MRLPELQALAVASTLGRTVDCASVHVDTVEQVTDAVGFAEMQADGVDKLVPQS